MHITESLTKRFWLYVSVGNTTDCWMWVGDRGKDGYGRIWHEGKTRQAHRVAFFLFGGVLPPNKPSVLHTCDTPACVNPTHLFAGDTKDNNADRDRKGRNADVRGEKNACAKLNTAQVLAIHQLYKEAWMTKTSIAEIFGVSPANVCLIGKEQTWAHLWKEVI